MIDKKKIRKLSGILSESSEEDDYEDFEFESKLEGEIAKVLSKSRVNYQIDVDGDAMILIEGNEVTVTMEDTVRGHDLVSLASSFQNTGLSDTYMVQSHSGGVYLDVHFVLRDEFIKGVRGVNESDVDGVTPYPSTMDQDIKVYERKPKKNFDITFEMPDGTTQKIEVKAPTKKIAVDHARLKLGIVNTGKVKSARSR